MANRASYFWHDYETFGADPMRNAPVQFAGIRTDLDFNVIDEPVNIFCRPALDFLPHPQACAVTGITPQQALRDGLSERDFAREVNRQLAMPGTCGVGYNSIRFDDEVTRHTLFRNYLDPYAREWQHNNSRWDLIDLVRMAYALRPDGIQWPQYETGELAGRVSFRLETLSVANGVLHENAHDALADVYATIGVAKLIKDQQPRLFDFYFGLRKKQQVKSFLQQNSGMFLHISSMYPATRGCMAPAMVVAAHPVNNNAVFVYDLSIAPEQFSNMDVEQLRELSFTPTAKLKEGQIRLPIKLLHLNKSPAVAPLSVLREQDKQRWQWDSEQYEANAQALTRLLKTTDFGKNLQTLHSEGFESSDQPAEFQLYSGFINDVDKQLCQQISNGDFAQLPSIDEQFRARDFVDGRLAQLMPRYRAVNFWPDLSQSEQQSWLRHCAARIDQPPHANLLNWAGFEQALSELDNPELVAQLRAYGEQLKTKLTGLDGQLS